MAIRQPIVVVLGHVDHGKTTLLDRIRGTLVAAREAGQMTQHIGASFFPLETLKKICGPVLERVRGEIRVPGLLVIDTPGHASFVNLRRRGGSIADIAILVVDVMKGFEPQTLESIDILRARKTPFLVAANKIDLIPGWKSYSDKLFLESLKLQDPAVRADLDKRIYEMVGILSRLGFRSERYDRIKDFTKSVAIVPVSAKTGEGIPELLAVLIGLTQQYLRKRLVTTEGPAKGTVLEVREEPGLGTTINAIIYDGVLRSQDTLVLGGKTGPIVTKIRSILMPKPLDEMRDPRDKFTPVDEVHAAAGVKIAAHGLEQAIPGSPLYAAWSGNEVEELIKSVTEEIEQIRIQTEKVGVVVKADTLGSLEAILGELEKHGVPVRIADVGDISRREVVEASIVGEENHVYGVVLGFNVKVLPDAEEEAHERGVRIFLNNVIYQLIDDYVLWMRGELEEKAKKALEALVRPGKIRVLPGYVFRRSKPAIFGVEVLGGRIKPKCAMINTSGKVVGTISQIQDRGEAISEATIGMQVAVSMKEPIVGRHVREGDILYVDIPERHAKILLTEFADRLDLDELEVLKELVEIKRKQKPYWGM